MDPRYAAVYARLYREHWWWRARERVVLGAIEKAASRHPKLSSGAAEILDIGCGDGLFFDALAARGQVSGIEVDAAVVGPGAERRRIFVGTLQEFRPPDGTSFDLVTMLDVLEHLADPVAALARVHALIAPGGCLVLTVPAHRILWTSHDVYNHHYRRYGRRELVEQVGSAGFVDVESRYFFHWTVAAKLVQRLAEGLVARSPTLPRVPPPLPNRLLFLASRFEDRATKRLRLPFGSSLLLIASRL